MDEKTKQENRELAKTVQFNGNGFQIQNLAQATLVAETLMSSGLVPNHFNGTAKIIVVAQAAKELHKPVWWGLNNMYVVNGKVGIAAAAVAGLILESGQCDYWNITEENDYPNDDFAIIISSRRKGHQDVNVTKFSIDDAKTAGLWGRNTWKNYPKTMLTWRAISFHARLYYSDVLGGSYTAEELSDIETPPESPTPQVPKRDERKQIDAKIKDTNKTAEELFNDVVLKFRNMLFDAGKLIKDDVSLQKYFADFVSYEFRDAKDLDKPETYTLEFLKAIDDKLVIALPQAVLETIPDAPKSAIQKEAQEVFKF